MQRSFCGVLCSTRDANTRHSIAGIGLAFVIGSRRRPWCLRMSPIECAMRRRLPLLVASFATAPGGTPE